MTKRAWPLPVLEDLYPLPTSRVYPAAAFYLKSCLADNEHRWLPLFAWSFTHALGKAITPLDFEDQSLSWLDEWQLSKIINETYLAMGLAAPEIWRLNLVLRLMVAQQNWFEKMDNKPLNQILENWLADSEVQRFIGVNRYKDVLWFNQESFEEFVWTMLVTATLTAAATPGISSSDVVETINSGMALATEDRAEARLALFLAELRLTSTIDAKMPMMAMTIKSSIRVKPFFFLVVFFFIIYSPAFLFLCFYYL